MTNFVIFAIIIITSSSPEIMDKWMYTSTTPIRLHGVYTGTTSPSKTGLQGGIRLSHITQEKLYCGLAKSVDFFWTGLYEQKAGSVDAIFMPMQTVSRWLIAENFRFGTV